MYSRLRVEIVGVHLEYHKWWGFDLRRMYIFNQRLLNYLKQAITEAANKPSTNDDVTLIVLYEYAFSRFPVPSKFKSYILRQLYDHIKSLNTERNIIIVPGSFHHYKKRITENEKTQSKLKIAKEYYKNSSYPEHRAERKQIESMSNQDEFYSLSNQTCILSNLSSYKTTKRSKRDDYKERERFHGEDHQQLVKTKAVYFAGEGSDAVKKITLKNGRILTIGILICLEHSEEKSVAQMAIKAANPDIELVISNSVQKNDHWLYGRVTAHMDSHHDFYVNVRKDSLNMFSVSSELKNFDIPNNILQPVVFLDEITDVVELKKFLYPEDIITVFYHDNNVATLLWIACKENRFDIVKYLISQGADINFRSLDNEWLSCLEIAWLHGHTDIVNYLKERNADFNLKECITFAMTFESPIFLLTIFNGKENINSIMHYICDHDNNLLTPLINSLSSEKIHRFLIWAHENKRIDAIFDHADRHNQLNKLYSVMSEMTENLQKDFVFIIALKNKQTNCFEYLTGVSLPETIDASFISLLRLLININTLDASHTTSMQETQKTIVKDLDSLVKNNIESIQSPKKRRALQRIAQTIIVNAKIGMKNDALLSDFKQLECLLSELTVFIEDQLQEKSLFEELSTGVKSSLFDKSKNNIRIDLIQSLQEMINDAYMLISIGTEFSDIIQMIIGFCQKQSKIAQERHEQDPLSLSFFKPSRFSHNLLALIEKYENPAPTSTASKRPKSN